MAEKYLPLKIIDIEDYTIKNTKNDLDILRKFGYPIEDENEYIKELLSLYFSRNKNTEKLLSALIFAYDEMLKSMGLYNEKFLKDPRTMLANLYDIILKPHILTNYWKKNKQVYKPDGDFCEALLKTENLVLTKEMFEHLPCQYFYVDVSNYERFLPIKGLFVNIIDIDGGKAIVVYQISEDSFWSIYEFFDFSMLDKVDINAKDYIGYCNGTNEYSYADFNVLFNSKRVEKQGENGISPKECAFFVYQLMTYMTSHEPQIEENSITKTTYRKPKEGSAIKNKYSELQMWDVGIRFGQSFKEKKRKYNCNVIMTSHEERKARKSPVPHFRSAHWQRYWIGKGRVTPIVKWKEPTFVGGESKDIVIHAM